MCQRQPSLQPLPPKPDQERPPSPPSSVDFSKKKRYQLYYLGGS
ncbi:2344_t:CDS:1, partial [Racocetra fulgida]